MSEDFEIGVTLALSDGVSDGVTRARKEIAQLEHVLRGGGVSVQQLRAAAEGAVSAMRAPQEPAKARKSERPAVDDRGVAAVGPAVTPTEMPRTVDAVAPVRLQAAQQAAAPASGRGGDARGEAGDRGAWVRPVGKAVTAETAPVMAVPVVRQAAMVAQVGGAAPAPVSVAVQAAAPAPAAPQAVAPVPPAVPADRTVATALTISGGAAPAPAEPAVARPAAAAPVSVTRDVPLAAAPLWVGGGQPGQTGPLNSPVAQAGPGTGAAPASQQGFGERAAGGPAAGTVGDAAGAPAAPPATAGAAGPTEGDVFLDGMLVGRWMSRFLNQEASRASVGPTGFDPRRGRLLPGATVGG